MTTTTRWDKGKWHYESHTFPANLPREAGYAHMVAVLRFFHEKGLLTEEGEEELQGAAGDDIALLPEHFDDSVHPFLDAHYEEYLDQADYGKAPPIDVLSRAWDAYTPPYPQAAPPARTQRATNWYAWLVARVRGKQNRR